MPDSTSPRRPSAVVASVISALAAMVSCGVADALNKTTALWPTFVAFAAGGYLTFRVLAPARAPESAEDAAERELSRRGAGGFAWRAAMKAWLLCIAVFGFFALDFKFIQFSLHEQSKIPVIDFGLGLGVLFGLPVALGVLVLGYRRPERLSSDELAVPTIVTAHTTRVTRPAISLELAAAIGALTGIGSCGFTMLRISEPWGIPVGILVSLIVFKAASYAREEEAASRASGAEQDPLPATGAPLPLKLAALVWAACVVVGGSHASGLRVLAPASELRPLIIRGMLAGATFGVPLAIAVLFLGWRRKANPRRQQPLFQRPAAADIPSPARSPATPQSHSAPEAP